MNEFHLRQEIVKIGRLMYEKGFIVSSDGNVSARLGNGRILITPSGLHKGMLKPDQLLIVDENGRRLGPSAAANRRLKPTSELPMHLDGILLLYLFINAFLFLFLVKMKRVKELRLLCTILVLKSDLLMVNIR